MNGTGDDSRCSNVSHIPFVAYRGEPWVKSEFLLFSRSVLMLGVGECRPVLGQLVGMEVSRGSLHKVPVIDLKAEGLGPRVLEVKEVMFK